MKLDKLLIENECYNNFQKIKSYDNNLVFLENEINFIVSNVKYFKTYENESIYIKKYLQKNNVKIVLKLKKDEYDKIKENTIKKIFFIYEDIKILIQKIHGSKEEKNYYLDLYSYVIDNDRT
jgi:hypothetical protein